MIHDPVEKRSVRRWSSVPLRVGLAVALVVLSAAALLASGIGVHGALSRSLTDRVDEQLYDAGRTWAAPRPVSGGTAPDRASDQPRRFFELRASPTGQVYLELPGGVDASDLPDLTGHLGDGPATTKSASTTGGQWRVLTVTNEFGSTTIGLSLADNDETLARLAYFELAIGATTLLAFGAVGFLVVRRSLRPLRVVEETAAAIAGGDLNRRVPVRGAPAEVDRLAQALNAMLARIQHGVDATAASQVRVLRSEERMRQFVADAGHELRTPLTTIRGFAELYRLGASSDPDAVLERIEGEAQRMSALVEDLLTLARLDAEYSADREPVDQRR